MPYFPPRVGGGDHVDDHGEDNDDCFHWFLFVCLFVCFLREPCFVVQAGLEILVFFPPTS